MERPTMRKQPHISHNGREAILTIRQAAALLHCHQSTLYRLLWARELPGFKLGGSWRFRREALDRWIERRTARRE
jgi:excisionase family DNA binding protein